LSFFPGFMMEVAVDFLRSMKSCANKASDWQLQ